MSMTQAYIVAARRTPLGRVGGLHGRRRIADLAAPVVQAVLGDCRVRADRVDGVIIGNATESSNPARLIGLSAGLLETTSALTVDRQCASGLEAIVQACRAVSSGEGDVWLAGGAEALSTAPWRVARPRHIHQIPRFIGLEATSEDEEGSQTRVSGERLARDLGITRVEQDAVALRSHLAAAALRESPGGSQEIVSLRNTTLETRDELVRNAELDDFADQPGFDGEEGLLTAANTAHNADGAAMVVVVSPRVWEELGCPRALQLVSAVTVGASAANQAVSAIAATQRLLTLHNDLIMAKLAAIETSETSAAQLIAFARHFGLDPMSLNSGGGAIARGHPFGAASAVLVVRLYSTLVRQWAQNGLDRGGDPAMGLATLSAIGGLASAALFVAHPGRSQPN